MNRNKARPTHTSPLQTEVAALTATRVATIIRKIRSAVYPSKPYVTMRAFVLDVAAVAKSYPAGVARPAGEDIEI